MSRNRLAGATSPYLLQHADNPVDWWEWGEAAFEEARRRDRPILLSVGYASCHWCHVMAHESFEDAEIAALMNRWFVNVKVDREERPDVDRVYMDAVQAVTGRGGWPMTVILTPDGHPFFAGTYFPATDRSGHPSFRRVLEAVRHAWDTQRAEVLAGAGRLAGLVARPIPPADALPTRATLRRAHDLLAGSYDEEHGGFGAAPKFPQAPTLGFLLDASGRAWAPRATEMLTGTLEAMARGGIRDHLGGGFSRYSVDERWLVPHFEKMLYDNAQLARVYLGAGLVTGDERLVRIARETLDYMLRDLELPGGGLSSGEDADSEGVEGRFYVFDHDEFLEQAGADAALAGAVLGVTPEGNFEGSNILHTARPSEAVAADAGVPVADVERSVARTRERLAAARSARIRPGRDDKVVAAWNGLAVRALAEAGSLLAEERYLDAARRTATYVLDRMRRSDGRLLRARRGGRGSVPGFCDDYAATALGLFALHAATGEPLWYEEAAAATEAMVELFWDDEDGACFATGRDAERLIARPKNLHDNPTPSDNALAAEALLHLAAYTGEAVHRERVETILRAAGRLIEGHPTAAGRFLSIAVTLVEGTHELAIVGTPGAADTEALAAVARRRLAPGLFVAVGGPGCGIPLVGDRPQIGGRATAYLCRDFTCDAPTTDPAALAASLDGVLPAAGAGVPSSLPGA